MKPITALILALALAFAFTAGASGDTAIDGSGQSVITLAGDAITFEGTGAIVSGSTVTITSAGTYTLRGTLDDGQVIVDTGDDQEVTLVLDGAYITSSTGAPVYIVNADKTVITLADGTANSITDGITYILPDAGSDEPNAAIFSKDDLTINGGGSLAVHANYNDGITSKDDLKITGGSIIVNAVNDGIRGRDSVTVKGGSVSVNAAGDGIQSNNDEDSDKGYISVEGGSVSIVSGADGIQAETNIYVSGGIIDITAGGGSGNAASTNNNGGNGGAPGGMGGPGGFAPSGGQGTRVMGASTMTSTATATTATSGSDSTSMKGLKAGVGVIVSGGTVTVNAADDAINTNDLIGIDGGSLRLSTGDDALHADSSLRINAGDITIPTCYEGIESADIAINGGNIHLTSRDDGVNAVADGTGQSGFDAAGGSLSISGGYLVVDAGGDGIDVNGPITMSGGTVIINGPTDNGNGALDFLNSFSITGGYLLAAGSSGMAQAPGTSSSQCSVMITYASQQAAGTLVHIGTAGGADVLTFAPAKTYQSVVFSSPLLTRGAGYVVYSGGSSTGSATDGVYSGGAYTPGTEIANFTISGTVTSIGSGNAQMPRMNVTMPGNRTGVPAGGTVGNRTWTNPGGLTGNLSGLKSGTVPGSTINSFFQSLISSILGNITGSTPVSPAGTDPGIVPDRIRYLQPGNESTPVIDLLPGSIPESPGETWSAPAPGLSPDFSPITSPGSLYTASTVNSTGSPPGQVMRDLPGGSAVNASQDTPSFNPAFMPGGMRSAPPGGVIGTAWNGGPGNLTEGMAGPPSRIPQGSSGVLLPGGTGI
ncbi:hypothetical protein J2741_002451 [Methanolinea mesophila]|uniref:carbohydrate-binding domain-containing protein n=1 Tax=Methanolinea mesophila TaxID=547055 RepID=UPI001AE39D68|nr:carbohydrate-binding domain-containing protein [Methanolinea mesophila]MBP1929855.1 hypothetical protein [Methanolinea mesophila]